MLEEAAVARNWGIDTWALGGRGSLGTCCQDEEVLRATSQRAGHRQALP